jgi:hypothetical protein
VFGKRRHAEADPLAEVALSLRAELEQFWQSGVPRTGPRTSAYADWWLARAAGVEQHDQAPVTALEDAELRELIACLREFSNRSSVLLVIQLRDAAWELQEELNRRTDSLEQELARAARAASGSLASAGA